MSDIVHEYLGVNGVRTRYIHAKNELDFQMESDRRYEMIMQATKGD